MDEFSLNIHCPNCGAINPEIVYEEGSDNGLTVCCHEEGCISDIEYEFGDGKVSVRACCWAVAELKFKKENIDIHSLQIIRRFSLEDYD